MRATFSVAASQDSGLGPQLGSGAQSVPCAHVPHFCIGCLLGDARVDAAGREGASLCPCRLDAARVSSGVLAPEPGVPHESWGMWGAQVACVCPQGSWGPGTRSGGRTLRRGQACLRAFPLGSGNCTHLQPAALDVCVPGRRWPASQARGRVMQVSPRSSGMG